jgi:hypothetical protein
MSARTECMVEEQPMAEDEETATARYVVGSV